MSELLAAMRYDFNVVGAMAGPIESFSQVDVRVLLLGGSKSPRYLKQALTALEHILPHACRYEFHGLDHSAAWNCDRSGDPLRIAAALRDFF